MKLERRVLLSASLFHALNDGATVAVPMIFPLLYNLRFIIHSYSHIGLLSNLGLMTTFFFQILIVQFANRFEYRMMLLVSFLGICLSLSLITSSSSFLSLLFLYLLFRIFDSYYHTVGLAWVSDTHPDRGIDFAMGVQSGSGNLGVFGAFIFVGYLAQRFNWKISLLFWAGVCFVMGMVSYLAVRQASSKKEKMEKLSLSSWMKTMKAVKLYTLGFIFGGASWGTTVYFAPSLLNHKFGIPLGKTGLFLALWIGIGTVTTYSFGFLSQRFGRYRIALVGFAGSSLSLIVLGVAFTAVMAVLSLFIFGTFLFLIYPAFQSYVGNKVPSENQAQAFSLVSNIQILSGAFFALAGGFLSDKFGIGTPFLVMGGLGVLIFLFYALKSSHS